MICNNLKCTKGPGGRPDKAKKRGLYCSVACGDSVRHGRMYKRRKAGVIVKDCPHCGGTGSMEVSRIVT